MNTLELLGVEKSEYRKKIIDTLSSYTEVIPNEDGTVNYINVKTDYFLNNDKWHIDELGKINNFKHDYENCKCTSKNIYFKFNNPHINLEIKYVIYNKLFSSEWSLTSCFMSYDNVLKKLAEFINERHSHLSSILDINIDKVQLQWTNWLEKQGITTITQKYDKAKNKTYTRKTKIVSFFKNIYDSLFIFSDNREEWDKDIWDIRNLEKYGIAYIKSIADHYINFSNIKNKKVREAVKKYFKQRLINQNIAWRTTQENMSYLPNFLNFILEEEPQWNDLNQLQRYHIEKYIEWLNEYTKQNLKISNPNRYKNQALKTIHKFLKDIQREEYDIASQIDTKKLFLPGDIPKLKKKPYDQIDYIPDYVLEQVMNNIDKLHEEAKPVVIIMLYTGLRISDTLNLNQDCLVKLDGKFWLEADIEKTYIEGHRIPIEKETAEMLAVLIDKAKKYSNLDNNPEKYIFVRYSGKRKGKPFSSRWIREKLNEFARDINITDENDNIYRFKNHAFRHTYGIRMLNSGVDILVVQELLAHATPEMTLRYARLLDDTKRKQFEKAVQNGVYSFNRYGELEEEIDLQNNDAERIMEMLWTNHKLNAIDTPYGTCLQRTKGKCNFALQPLCLTCDNGSPCRNLLIQPNDIEKYQLLMKYTGDLVNLAERNQKQETVESNKKVYNLYEQIYSVISNGNIIFGNRNRVLKEAEANG